MNDHEEELEPTIDVETSSMMEPISTLVCKLPVAPPKEYWQAQNLARILHQKFEELKKSGDIKEMRGQFFVLAHYYGRTLGILRQALSSGNEPLINTALRNLVMLHQPIHHMHEVAPTTVPFAITLDKKTRRKLVEDLIILILQESAEPLLVEAITSRVNDLHFMVNVKMKSINNYLDDLIAKGHVLRIDGGFSRTKRAYSSINLDHASLAALLGEKLYQEFEQGGFPGLSNIVNRKESFQKFFQHFAHCSNEMAEMFIAASIELLGTHVPDISPWKHSDLIGSLIPRPYQHDAFSIFRGYGYHGQVIEAPSGSGKTMIGMMCIQDWLRSLSSGESILIIVPTVNYEQQWVGELCYKPIGLELSPDVIFTGTPADMKAQRTLTGTSPAILITTYTAIAQLGSPAGKGGFDRISVEQFLQGNNIKYVILDEVHKVAEDTKSVSARVTLLITEWLQDGSLRGLIGFSGTAAAFRDRFETLGLELVYTMPAADLIGYGFVAPFAEYGVPFTYSDREKSSILLLKKYRSYILEYIDLLGYNKLKKLFTDIPLEKRIFIGRDILGLYSSHKDRDDRLIKRYVGWENKEKFTLSELPMVTIIQIARGFSDKALLEETISASEVDEKEKKQRLFQNIIIEIKKIREELKGLVFFHDITLRLNASDFGDSLNAEHLLTSQDRVTNRSLLTEQVKNELSSSIVGLYNTLKSLYLRMGEGRIDSIKSIIDAEHSSRKVTGVIIFDSAKRIRWENDTAIPGFTGVGGIFAQMLGDKRWTPMAALSNEIYLPYTETDILPAQIADHIKQKIMLSELGKAFFDLITQRSGLSEEQHSSLGTSFEILLKDYVFNMKDVEAIRPGEFNRKVIKKFRRIVKKEKMGSAGEKIWDRLSLKHNHIHKWIENFFDYAIIANNFLNAKTGELRQAGGTYEKFFIVKMAESERKQLMYDLIARIVDAEDLSVNVIIVSSWARTGWNVISPNILIDATATRNVTAWQQLRGRAMRALPTWNRDCYEIVMLLLGSPLKGIEEAAGKFPPDVFAFEDLKIRHETINTLNEKQKQLLLETHQAANMLRKYPGEDPLPDKIMNGNLEKLNEDEKELLAAELMMSRNKVTHIFELVKAYGSTSQVKFDKTSKTWQRIKAIASKHNQEYSINPITGQYSRGESHIPLFFVHDPHKNLPSLLREFLVKELRDRDPLIVHGWIKAVLSRTGEFNGKH